MTPGRGGCFAGRDPRDGEVRAARCPGGRGRLASWLSGLGEGPRGGRRVAQSERYIYPGVMHGDSGGLSRRPSS